MRKHIPVACFTGCYASVNDTQINRQIVMSYLDPVLELGPNIKPITIGLLAGSLGPNRNSIVPEKDPYGVFME
jgi:hypothetical protein